MNRMINAKPLLFRTPRVPPDPRAAMILQEKLKAVASPPNVLPGALYRTDLLRMGMAPVNLKLVRRRS